MKIFMKFWKNLKAIRRNKKSNKKTEIIETSEGAINKEVNEKTEAQLTIELVEYVPNSILRKTILKKATGSITVSSFDTDEALAERIKTR